MRDTPQPSRDQTSGGPDIYSLYGEAPGESGLEHLHIEDIEARARLYHWTITPHAHSDMLQVIFIFKGGADALIEDRRAKLSNRTVICIPDGVVHGFEFEAKTQGWVLSVERRLLERIEFAPARDFLLQGSHAGSTFKLSAHKARDINVLFARLHHEFANMKSGREIMLDSLCAALLVLILRDMPREASGNTTLSGAAATVSAYRNLVNRHFREHWNVRQYAEALSISQSRLARACRAQTGKAPAALINARVLLEAQRNLHYTEASAARIAQDLGFQDPAYFSRFFKRMTGSTPRDYRLQSRRRD